MKFLRLYLLAALAMFATGCVVAPGPRLHARVVGPRVAVVVAEPEFVVRPYYHRYYYGHRW